MLHPIGCSALVALAVVTGSVAQAASPSSSTSPAAPAPLCRDTAPGPVPGEPAHAGDGVRDPSGRIVFGQITKVLPDTFGQVVSLYAVDADGSDYTLVLDCDAGFPKWSPDGTRIAFHLFMDDGSIQIATVAPDGSDLTLITSGPGVSLTPTWAPDSSWLAYVHSPEPDPAQQSFLTAIWRVDADGTDAREFGDPLVFADEPRLSPDGSEILFSRLFPDEEWAVRPYVRDLATGADRNVLPNDRQATHPDWTPDGQGVIYSPLGRPDGLQPQLETIDAADPAATPTVLFAGTRERGAYKGSYSPDGKHIVFGCNTVRPGHVEDAMCLMDADGSNVRVLRDRPLAENHFTWGMPAS
jgi:Tol biopolymer transport system component